MLLFSGSNGKSPQSLYADVSKTHAEYGFTRFSAWLKNACGINLPCARKYLAVSKLNTLLKQYKNFDNLVSFLEKNPSSNISYQVIEAMTTNETMWFRDGYPFIALSDIILPNFKGTQLKVWSAASSSGQEAYSVAISCNEYAQAKRINLTANVLATDISRYVINQGMRGVYSQIELRRGLNADYLARYFERLDDNYWQIKNNLRQMVTFKYLNLIDNLAGLGIFDVIFCRNFMIYLDEENKNIMLNKLRLNLKKGGYLILGASEALSFTQAKYFKLVSCNLGIIYQAI